MHHAHAFCATSRSLHSVESLLKLEDDLWSWSKYHVQDDTEHFMGVRYVYDEHVASIVESWNGGRFTVQVELESGNTYTICEEDEVVTFFHDRTREMYRALIPPPGTPLPKEEGFYDYPLPLHWGNMTNKQRKRYRQKLTHRSTRRAE